MKVTKKVAEREMGKDSERERGEEMVGDMVGEEERWERGTEREVE